MDVVEANRLLERLHADLSAISKRDPEQEVQGLALPVLDAVLSGIRDDLLPPGHPVVRSLNDLISIESVESGEAVRAVDALLVVGQLLAAVGPPPPVVV